jgi:hypothetical protein
VKPRHRDAVLASAVTLGLLALVRVQGVDTTTLLDPAALLVGAAGAVGLELLMARFPDLSRQLWYRPSVQALAVVAVFVGGVVLATLTGPWVFGAVLGGLATYFLLLALVLTGVVPEPETWFDDER